MGTITKYASVVEKYQNAYLHTNDWSDLKNATNSESIFASSKYNTTGGVKYTPSQIYAHDFDIDLPTNSRLKQITFEVRIKGTDVDALVPRANFLFNGMPAHQYENTFDGDAYQPNAKLSSSFNNVSYTIDSADIQLANINESMLESDNFGVILSFNDQLNNGEGGVAIEWVRITVEYVEPRLLMEIRGSKLTPNEWQAPYQYKLTVGEVIKVSFFIHNDISTPLSEPKTIKLNIPLGLHIQDYYVEEGASFNPLTNEVTYDWANGRSMSPYVTLTLKARYTGLKKISMTGDSSLGSLVMYTFVEKGWLIGADEDVSISSTEIRRWEESCFHFAIRTINEDGTAGFDIHLDGNDRTQTNHLVSWNIDESRTSEGVVWNEAESNDDYIEFFVPQGKEVELHFTSCFLPKTTGANTLVLESTDTGFMYTYDYVSLEPYTYVIDLLSHDVVFSDARMVSTINTGAYSYPIGVSEYDTNIVTDKSTLRLSKFQDIDYIGCVPLQQTHFNPKSTYKDTLLNTSYKNKRYMGKKGVIDETITLNVRLPPRDVTTMQGLVAMDKPVPINANHKCFEGDALNHRGWCELYGITATKTNPHWYKCELSVKYITHNLNTRFKINKGSRVSDYFLPELMTPVFEFGDDLTDKFLIETNGGYFYNKTHEDAHMRNYLPLGNGKSFAIRGMDKLSIKSQVNLNWYSTRNVENVHNDVSRIVRLIDAETNNAVVEYEWYDIDFSRTYEYNCRVICRVLYKGAYKTILNRNLVLNKDVEYDPSDTDGLDVYGSQLIFKIVGDKLTIQDCGFSGKELYIEDIDIQNGQYYFDVEFQNNNIHSDANDIGNWIDIDIQELKLSSMYSNFYKNMLVSPFPVPNKQIIFTRRSEEGTIFYLKDDGLETSYMVNPYYQYHCGVDLQSRDGISIFNLDNNYRTIYITNGLIKLGINRYNGRMYLYRYDKNSDEYILTNRLQLTKYEDININSFTDDKLELQASDSVFTVWRGHPYVHISHPTEDILFGDKFTKIYSDGVGETASTLPQFWNLIDTTNLLSECLGSDRKIKADCWTFVENEIEDKIYDVACEVIENNGIANPSIIGADCGYNYTSMKFIIDGECYDGVEYDGSDSYLHTIEHQFTESGKHTIQAIYYGRDDYWWSQQRTINIEDNAYHITPTFPSHMYYLQNDYTCVLTYQGNPVPNETVVFFVNGLSYPKLTDENGVARLNNRLSPKEQQSVTIDGVPTDTGKSQPSSYLESYEPYVVGMDYWEDGELKAHSEKECTIEKGYVNISVDKTTLNQTEYLTFTFKNNLDPNDDDVTADEVLVTGKSALLTINGRDYPRITDSNGQCKLQINLNPGSYDLKVTFGGDHQYNGTIKNMEIKVNEQ